jgi:hypothetical protein
MIHATSAATSKPHLLLLLVCHLMLLEGLQNCLADGADLDLALALMVAAVLLVVRWAVRCALCSFYAPLLDAVGPIIMLVAHKMHPLQA